MRNAADAVKQLRKRAERIRQHAPGCGDEATRYGLALAYDTIAMLVENGGGCTCSSSTNAYFGCPFCDGTGIDRRVAALLTQIGVDVQHG